MLASAARAGHALRARRLELVGPQPTDARQHPDGERAYARRWARGAPQGAFVRSHQYTWHHFAGQDVGTCKIERDLLVARIGAVVKFNDLPILLRVTR